MFALVPVLAAGLAAATTGTFSLRYGVAGVVGIACLAALGFGRLRSGAGALFAMLFFGFFAAEFAGQLWWASRGYEVKLFRMMPDGFFTRTLPVKAAAAEPEKARPMRDVPGHPLLAYVEDSDLPLVIAGGLAFLEVEHYADAALLARTYYLTDAAASQRQTGAAWFESAYPKMKGLFRLRASVKPAGEFLAHHRRFIAYSPGYVMEWLLPELRARGWRVTTLASRGPALLAEVSGP
jgi:hypothetical protein